MSGLDDIELAGDETSAGAKNSVADKASSSKPTNEVVDENLADDSEVETEESDQDSDDSEAEATDEENDQDSEEGENDKPLKKKKGGFQRKLEARDKTIAQLQQENERLKYNPQAPTDAGGKKEDKTQQQDGRPVKPDASKFDNYSDYQVAQDKYTEDLTDWKIKQSDSEKSATQQREAALNDYKKQTDSFFSKVSEFSKNKETSDMNEIVEELKQYPFSTGLDQLVIYSEFGPQVAYELGKNIKELDRINALGPVAQAREIGKIEARIEARLSKPKETKKVSSAPDPISTVKGKGTIAKKTISEMSDDEYIENFKQKRKRS